MKHVGERLELGDREREGERRIDADSDFKITQPDCQSASTRPHVPLDALAVAGRGKQSSSVVFSDL